MPEAQCSREHRPASACCVGTPWENPDLGMQIMHWGEPLYPSVIEVAARTGLNPHDLAGHVEGGHGWEPHDTGYDEAVERAAGCLLAGSPCELEDYNLRLQMERLKRRVDHANAVRDFAAQTRIAASDMRHHFRLPEDAVIVVKPSAALVDHAREALRADPTLVVSDERERRHG
jgi:hypothetical protein